MQDCLELIFFAEMAANIMEVVKVISILIHNNK